MAITLLFRGCDVLPMPRGVLRQDIVNVHPANVVIAQGIEIFPCRYCISRTRYGNMTVPRWPLPRASEHYLPWVGFPTSRYQTISMSGWAVKILPWHSVFLPRVGNYYPGKVGPGAKGLQRLPCRGSQNVQGITIEPCQGVPADKVLSHHPVQGEITCAGSSKGLHWSSHPVQGRHRVSHRVFALTG